MLLKREISPSIIATLHFWSRLRATILIVFLLQDSCSGSGYIRLQSMGPYGAHHASEKILLLCLTYTSSCESGAKVSKVHSRIILGSQTL